MSTRTSVRDYLACEYHGETTADQICGECGTPLCDDCSATVTDVLLDDYRPNGVKLVLFGLLLAVAGPLLVNAVPRPVWLTLTDAAGKPLYIQGGLRPALIVVGVALLAKVRYRRVDDGFGLFNVQALTRRSNDRTVCENCYPAKRTQKLLGDALGLLAALLVLYGLYRSFSALFFQHLRYVGLGVALGVLRYDVVAAVSEFLE